MTNQSTNSPVKRQRRYTVSRLLELAPQARPINFDLSKFTYDAARAGVVPPLGACAMSNRRTSTDRPRGWSQESGSSQEEVIVYQGNRVLKNPERQPTVPPTSPRAQKDEGFARFLKKHSSPTHQRVTTGGRIVPMEQQPRPPVFSLPPTSQVMEEHKNNANEGVNGITKPQVAGNDAANAGVVDNNNHLHSQLPSFMPIGPGILDTSPFTTGPNANVMAGSNPFAFDVTRMPPGYPQAMSPVPFFAGMHGDPYSMMTMQSQVYPGTPLPVTGLNGGVDPHFPTPFIPNPHMLGLPPSCGITTTPTDPLPQASCYGEKILKDSIEQFHTLDEQLKNLDRHRAMHELDPYLASQRMTIVQLRADAKDSATFWAEKVGYDLQGIFKHPTGTANSKLNVQASSYVPLRAHHSGETLSEESGSSFKLNGIGHTVTKPDFVVDSTRRPIPIVPPPGKLPSPQKNSSGSADSNFEAVEVDEWGVRVGPAPPEIQHQQNEMLKELVRQTSMSPLRSSENAATYTPQGSHVVTPLTNPYEGSATKKATDTGFGESEWLPIQPGRAPPTVEACYEVQLDAMRLPSGTVAKVRMPDGIVTEVRGCGLKRPRSFDMDEFLHRYWTSKPSLTKEMFDNFVEIRPCGGNAEPVSVADYLDMEALSLDSNNFQMENTTEELSSRNSEASDKYSNESLNAVKNAENTQNLLCNNGSHGFGPAIERPHGSDLRPTSLKLSSASSPPMWPRADDKSSWFANEHSRNGRMTGSEAMSSKGFSSASVSVQNVHAMGRLPPVDGPSDGQRPSALSMLAAASNTASPLPTPRSIASSEAFSVPYGNGVLVVSDDVFRPE
ncbi:hypothetical protein H2200_003365 [Cladophialophora chaetospira]|uniref:Uncharacterized protein n=1 Tax=Cladophialophora chaetospira TaxID=386627 RepID=A0AA38XH76_9EURO|nr:hypothetical protein H2200_003365 [Cladophialophora chaetospira]